MRTIISKHKNQQGTRNTKLQLLPLKKGAFHLAIKSQVSF
jgi:hypothetical protein